MSIADFDFPLPAGLIANYPAKPRDSSRLLLIGKTLSEKTFRDLPSLLRPDDLLVFNNSKVIPARLFVKKDNSKIEIFLHKKLANRKWQAFAKPGKKLKVGDKFAGISIVEKLESGEVIIELENEKIISEQGHMPLPPYIKRPAEKTDFVNYQTVYASLEGSVAAPTAGLHFTNELLAKIPGKAFVTLHVGAGTFQPVKTANIGEHKMHSEYYEIPPQTEVAIKITKQKGGRIIAVGTTSLRVLEASGGESGSSETDIFIKPGYQFKIADAIITNFHLPKSTLFILTCALAGSEKMHQAYAHAIAHKFRFFSYGDACFIEKQ